MPLLSSDRTPPYAKATLSREQHSSTSLAMRTAELQDVTNPDLPNFARMPIGVNPKPGFFQNCSNPDCSSGWLHLLRSREAPVFETGWCCSMECLAARISQAIQRETNGRALTREEHRHRMPLGLLMLKHGWITPEQLKQAVDKQRTAGGGRLGSWLMRLYGISEQQITRALGLQWHCPVLSLEAHEPDSMTTVLPRLFVDAYGVLPVRIAGARILYLGFEERIDPVLALSIERMTGLQVECGIVQGSSFSPAHKKMLQSGFPSVQLIEAASEQGMTRALSRVLERAKPIDSRLVRVHDCLWLRLWKRRQITRLPLLDSVVDILCTIRT